MGDFDKYPKSVKKAVRWIKQDAPIEKLESIRELLDRAIEQRKCLKQGVSE